MKHGRSEKKSTGCRRNEQTSNDIRSAAAELLQDKGYARFTMEEVARCAGASKSTVYRWWPDKMHLLLDIFGSEVEKAIEVPDFGDIKKELIFLVRSIWKFWRETPSGQAFKSMIAEAQADPAAVELWRSNFLPERRKKLFYTLQRAADRGELRPDCDIPTIVDIFFGYGWYRLLTGQIDDDPAVITAMVREIVRGITRKD